MMFLEYVRMWGLADKTKNGYGQKLCMYKIAGFNKRKVFQVFITKLSVFLISVTSSKAFVHGFHGRRRRRDREENPSHY